MSLINKDFSGEGSGIVLAGAPARVVRRNITWDRRSPKDFA